MKLTEAEWAVMEVLWSGENFALGEITKALKDIKGWNKKTVYAYLTRMEGKGLVKIDRAGESDGDTRESGAQGSGQEHHYDRPYSAAVSRESCAKEERAELLTKVYGGATGDLIAAFLKESDISKQEIERLRTLLDEMEV